jgi:hypothetical protein
MWWFFRAPIGPRSLRHLSVSRVYAQIEQVGLSTYIDHAAVSAKKAPHRPVEGLRSYRRSKFPQ